MLSSQIISVSKTPASALLRSTGPLPRRPRPYQQIRMFRMGVWESYLDVNMNKELRRRHRMAKHKYMEALNRKLSWDRPLTGRPEQFSLKGFMCSAWRGEDNRSGVRYVGIDPLASNQDNIQKGNNRGIEEVEQSALDRLLKNRDDLRHLIRERSRSWTYRSNAASSSSIYDEEAFRKRFQKTQDSAARAEPEYEIDPITNRKVFKNKTEKSQTTASETYEIPVKTFRGYRSLFQENKPPQNASDSIPNPYKSRAETLEESADKSSQNGNVNTTSVQDGLEDYDRHVDYKSGQFYNPSSIEADRNNPIEEGLKEYDEKISSGNLRTLESNQTSNQVDPVHECLKEYDSKVDYNSGSFYNLADKDIDYSDPDQRGLKEYDSKVCCKASGACASLDATPQTSEKVDVSQDGWKQYDRKVDYKSGEFYEPAQSPIDYSDPVQSGLKDYDGKISRIDPGAFESITEQKSSKSEPKIVEGNAESLDPIERAFHEYDPVHENLKEYDTHLKNQQVLNDAEEAAKLDPVEEAFHEYDPLHGHLGEYESKGKPAPVWDMSQDPIDNKRRTNLASEHLEQNSKGFWSRGTAMMSKLLRNKSESRTEDIDLLRASDVRAASGISRQPVKETEADKLARRRALEDDFDKPQMTAEDIDVVGKVKMSRMRVESNPKIVETEALDHKPQKLTGNFVQDFPEEFEANWRVPEGGSGLTPKMKTGESSTGRDTENKDQSDGLAYIAGLAPKEQFARNPETPRIEPSLDRSTSKIPVVEGKKSDSKESNRALVREIRDIYEEAYGTIDSNHRQVPVSSSPENLTASATASEAVTPGLENAEPTLYKILAYDPTMQSISTAETTSIIPDSSSPLTPAEVLLRLSNPSKFFPHFQPLQNEGYEIVSGSGDVLVFRKVRSGAPPTSLKPQFAARDKSQELKYRTINPIDGMQSRPIAPTGNFASPTGFVNHDPPFKSNIDVRREEPVFSGKRNWEDEKTDPKAKGGRFKKVLIGAAWVGGCSYAIGVVAEFFKTGGVDGTGLQGF